MAKFNIKTVKPKFTITTAPDNKIDVVVNKPILTAKNTKTYFKLKNTGGLRGEKGEKGDAGTSATVEPDGKLVAVPAAIVAKRATPAHPQLLRQERLLACRLVQPQR